MPSHKEYSWWRHRMETFFALLAICAGNPPVPGEFPAQRPVTRSFDASFDLRLNKRLSKQSWGWWFEALSRPLRRHRNVFREIGLYFFPVLVCSESGTLGLRFIDAQTSFPLKLKCPETVGYKSLNLLLLAEFS